MLMWENTSGSPCFSILQATKSWAGPGNEAIIHCLCCIQQHLIL